MALRDSAQVVGAPSAGGAKVESGCCDFDVGTKLQAGPLLVISRVMGSLQMALYMVKKTLLIWAP